MVRAFCICVETHPPAETAVLELQGARVPQMPSGSLTVTSCRPAEGSAALQTWPLLTAFEQMAAQNIQVVMRADP